MKRARMSRRMLVAGYVPACGQDRDGQLALPKPTPPRGTMTVNESTLADYFSTLPPRGWDALSQIVETADLFQAADRQWLLVPADPWLLECLATFESEVAELEPEVDDDKHNDSALDTGGPFMCGNVQTDDYEYDMRSMPPLPER